MSGVNSKSWIIQRECKTYGIGSGVDLSYFNGETYWYLGERYGIFLSWKDRSEAKVYSSESRAKNAARVYSKNLYNSDKLVVVERKSIEKGHDGA